MSTKLLRVPTRSPIHHIVCVFAFPPGVDLGAPLRAPEEAQWGCGPNASTPVQARSDNPTQPPEYTPQHRRKILERSIGGVVVTQQPSWNTPHTPHQDPCIKTTGIHRSPLHIKKVPHRSAEPQLQARSCVGPPGPSAGARMTGRAFWGGMAPSWGFVQWGGGTAWGACVTASGSIGRLRGHGTRQLAGRCCVTVV
jgi:hypothetical protein